MTESGRPLTLDLSRLGVDADSNDAGASPRLRARPGARSRRRVDRRHHPDDRPGPVPGDVSEQAAIEAVVGIVATDRHGHAASSTVTVTVASPNIAPAAGDDAVDARPGETATFDIAFTCAPPPLACRVDPTGRSP